MFHQLQIILMTETSYEIINLKYFNRASNNMRNKRENIDFIHYDE